jgi:hypothetical protein
MINEILTAVACIAFGVSAGVVIIHPLIKRLLLADAKREIVDPYSMITTSADEILRYEREVSQLRDREDYKLAVRHWQEHATRRMEHITTHLDALCQEIGLSFDAATRSKFRAVFLQSYAPGLNGEIDALRGALIEAQDDLKQAIAEAKAVARITVPWWRVHRTWTGLKAVARFAVTCKQVSVRRETAWAHAVRAEYQAGETRWAAVERFPHLGLITICGVPGKSHACAIGSPLIDR